ncbi:MAG: restriction endonuclease subunit S [Candidatus Paceibacterota bacterium]|jgi:type I restriction enzyme S subunit
MSVLRLTQLGKLVYPDRPITYGIVQPGPDVAPEGIPLIRGKDYSSGKVDTSELYHVLPSIDKPYARSKVKAGDILLSIVGYLGQVAEVPESMEGANITQTTARISVDPEKACAHYLFQYFQSTAFRDEVRKFEKGSAQPGLNLSDLAKFEIHLTPRSEQTKIAEILSTVDRAISQTEALIAKQQRLKTGLMQDLLTRGIDEHGNLRSEQTHQFKDSPLGRIPVDWEVKPLSHYVARLDAGVSVNADDTPCGSGQIGVLKTSALSKGLFLPLQNKSVIREDLRRVRTSPRANTILISRMNTPALVGESAFVDRDYPDLFLPDRIWMTVFQEGKETAGKWLSFILVSSDARNYISLNATGTSGSMKNLPKKSLLNMPLRSPSCLDETQRIAEALIRIENNGIQSASQLNIFRSLKTALMQDLLTGRKRVTDLLDKAEALA